MQSKVNKIAIDLIDSFIELNQAHANESTETYGMSYAYHVKCALLVAKKLKSEDLIIELNSILKHN